MIERSGAMRPQDVERILRDVCSTLGLHVSSTVHAERTPNGWGVALTDAAGGVLSIDLPDGPPALIRAALTHWVDTAS